MYLVMKFLSNKVFWKFYSLYDLYCKYRLNKLIPGIELIIKDYSIKSKSTGTKYPTLYRAVKTIIQKKPKFILESGTGTSTLVFAETILLIKKKDPTYNCKIISMESIKEWYEMAKNLLPKKYINFVEIRLGEREMYEYSMFRGYAHSNIPHHNYDLVFLDGPNYEDEKGFSTCMDAIKIRLQSDAKLISCVIDTRVSSVWMMQQIFGSKIIKYFSIFRNCSFEMPLIHRNPQLDSQSFYSGVNGNLKLKRTNFIK